MTTNRAGGLSARASALLLFALGLAVLLPEFWTGPSTSDSLRYNIVWTDQFRAAVAGGNLYPRWLPASWDGLGSPTFYFYPPLAFWIGSVLDALTARLLPTGALLTLTSVVLLGGSGVAMRAWLAEQASPRAGLAGGAAYMIAPYHLYDIFARAALAETCAYAALPLVMLAMRRVGERGWVAVPWLALSYAALILSHLPVALLATVLLLPTFALFGGWGRPTTITAVVAGGVLGLCLAAAYLVPALGLTPYILAEAFGGDFYRPQSWFFWRDGVWTYAIMWVVGPAWLGAMLFAVAAAWRARTATRPGPTWFWSAAVLLIGLLIAGVPPAFWRLPAIAQVQFPWRLMVLVEFAAITAVAIAAPRLRNPLVIAGAIPTAAALAVAGALIGQRLEASAARSADDIASIRALYRDAPEYLPAGSALPLGEDGLPNPSLVRLPGPISAPDVDIATSPRANGGLDVIATSARRTDVMVRRFAFPHWHVIDAYGRAVPLVRDPQRLVGWIAPAGRSRYRLVAGRAPGEVLGLSISLVAALVLIGLAITTRRRGRHVYASPVQARA